MRRTLTPLLCAGALLLGAVACSDDDDTSSSDEPSSTTTSAPVDEGATTLAQGDDVELVGDGLGNQTLNITAEEAGGVVSGEFTVSETVVTRVDCANTDTSGTVVLGGEVTTGDPNSVAVEGQLLALIIVDGDPDRVALYANDNGAGSCTEMLETLPDDLTNPSNFVDVEAGSDIEIA